MLIKISYRTLLIASLMMLGTLSTAYATEQSKQRTLEEAMKNSEKFMEKKNNLESDMTEESKSLERMEEESKQLEEAMRKFDEEFKKKD